MTEGRRLVRGFLALSGGEIVAKLVGFAAFAYLARVLGPESYGAVELAVAVSLFFTLIIDFGLGPIGAREVARDAGRVPELAASVPTLRTLLAILAVAAMWLVPEALDASSATANLIRLYAMALFGAAWVQRWLFQGLGMMIWVSAGRVVRTLVFAAAVFILVRRPEQLLSVGVAEVAAAAAVALYYLGAQHLCVTPLHFGAPPHALVNLLRESLPLGISQALWALNQYFPTLVVGALAPPPGRELAWFGAAQRVAVSLASFSWMYHFNLFPSLSRRLGESKLAYERLAQSSFRVCAWGGIFIALVVTLLATPLCRLLFGAGFDAAGSSLAIVIWTVPISLLSGHARWALIAAQEQQGVLVAQAAGAATTLAMALLLAPRWGAIGAATAMVVSVFVIWLVSHRLAQRRVATVPFLAATAKPAGVALVAMVLASAATSHPPAVAAIAAFAYLGGAAIVDRTLLRDLARLLGEIRGEEPQPPEAHIAPGRRD